VTRNWSPNVAESTAAAAALKVLWPEMYSGKFGVTSSGVQFGSAWTLGLPVEAAAGMAVTGRQVP
jgi:hypothetical protein